jgi:competence ComEA-like helix-hairpin-helix protein
MKLKNVVFDYFSFNRAEQRGITVLLVLLFGLLAGNRFWPSRPLLPAEDAVPFEKAVRAFSIEIKQAEVKERMRRKPGYSKFATLPVTGYDTTFRQEKNRQPSFIIEVNAADTLELQRLRGIGPGFARRIVSYRGKLGGFIEKRQLLEVYGMDAERYGMIRDYITVNPDSVTKIDINNVTFKGLIGHPYFPYELTREVILYRKKARRFNNAEELRNVKGVNDSVFRKISPYVLVK